MERLTGIFDRLGFPTIIKSDNNPFNLILNCLSFAEESNTQLRTSCPRYPQSNGMAEKGVAIAKNLLNRCVEVGNVDQYQYHILEYTPVASMQSAPSQLFFGRMLKTKMPITESLLTRNDLDEGLVRNRIESKRYKQKYYFCCVFE